MMTHLYPGDDKSLWIASWSIHNDQHAHLGFIYGSRISYHTGLFPSKYFVSNKVKGRISKRVFQENKARQIFRKTSISYPLTRTRMCAYQEVKIVRFSENLACFVFLKHSFWDSSFCLITDELYTRLRPHASVLN